MYRYTEIRLDCLFSQSLQEKCSKDLKHTVEQRKAYRLEKELPILEDFWKWLKQARWCTPWLKRLKPMN